MIKQWLCKMFDLEERHKCNYDVVAKCETGCVKRCNVCGGQVEEGELEGLYFSGFEPEPLSQGLHRYYGASWEYPDD